MDVVVVYWGLGEESRAGDRRPGARDQGPGSGGQETRARGRGPGAYRGRYGIACEGTCRVRGSSGRHGLSAGIRKAAPWEPLAVSWCPGRDLNPHTFRQRFLRPSCLPFHHPGVCASTQYSGNAVRGWLGHSGRRRWIGCGSRGSQARGSAGAVVALARYAVARCQRVGEVR